MDKLKVCLKKTVAAVQTAPPPPVWLTEKLHVSIWRTAVHAEN